MALNLKITLQSTRWAGPAPRLWLEHGAEQCQAPGGAAAALQFPYVPSKAVDILAFDPSVAQDERAFIAGSSFSAEQLLQQGGTGTVVLMDAQGALRGRVQLRAELVEAAGRLPPSLLDPAASPFADPTVQDSKAKPRDFAQRISEKLSRSIKGRGSKALSAGGGGASAAASSMGGASGASGESTSSGGGAAEAEPLRPAAAHLQAASFSPLTRSRGHLAARLRLSEPLHPAGAADAEPSPTPGAAQDHGDRARAHCPAWIAAGDAGDVRERVGTLEQAVAAAAGIEAPQSLNAESTGPAHGDPRSRRQQQQAGAGAGAGTSAGRGARSGPAADPPAASGDGSGGGGGGGHEQGTEVGLLEELARHGAERRAANAQLLMALARQTAADAEQDALLLAALGGGGGGGSTINARGTPSEGAGGGEAAGGSGGRRRGSPLGERLSDSRFESFAPFLAGSAKGEQALLEMPTPRLCGGSSGSSGAGARAAPAGAAAAGPEGLGASSGGAALVRPALPRRWDSSAQEGRAGGGDGGGSDRAIEGFGAPLSVPAGSASLSFKHGYPKIELPPASEGLRPRKQQADAGAGTPPALARAHSRAAYAVRLPPFSHPLSLPAPANVRGAGPQAEDAAARWRRGRASAAAATQLAARLDAVARGRTQDRTTDSSDEEEAGAARAAAASAADARVRDRVQRRPSAAAGTRAAAAKKLPGGKARVDTFRRLSSEGAPSPAPAAAAPAATPSAAPPQRPAVALGFDPPRHTAPAWHVWAGPAASWAAAWTPAGARWMQCEHGFGDAAACSAGEPQFPPRRAADAPTAPPCTAF
ncbi:hypothetical protein MNEG_10052 [Monoraphidium neglectum]|uniref:Uncharacterized protein n=1 Tax=Monoraphidium neglectum TaxID=145388 RepID=A0A0D2MAD0_9CHLO|nr:hypothetical protein MNEG_10052 [Monoraphidium neglectum]KIY97911.1 hypothetical protein MNEG_10052 [Monoraphidium neglectum]|eukprot:XP_013896931.1 hypothetical protein MNEG_10052 [Monoraphidium neglectum]